MPQPAGCSKILEKIQGGQGNFWNFPGLQLIYIIFQIIKIDDISPLKKALEAKQESTIKQARGSSSGSGGCGLKETEKTSISDLGVNAFIHSFIHQTN